MRHPVSVTIRPGRSENPATSQKSNGAGEPASRFELDLRRYECRVFPERAGGLARRMSRGCQGRIRTCGRAVNSRLRFRFATWQCIEESPPRRARSRVAGTSFQVVKDRGAPMSAHTRAFGAMTRVAVSPEWFRRESNSIRPLKRRLLHH